MKEIKLGQRVRCKITGFEGIAIAKSEFINGCIQYDILPRCKNKEKDKIPEAVSIDQQSLEIIKETKKKIIKKPTGGPNKLAKLRRNY